MHFLILYSAVLCIALSCGRRHETSAETERLRSQVYFTKSDPGRWKDFREDHDPQVKKIPPNQFEVSVPMNADIGHYIEVIFATDAANTELAVKNLKRGEKPHALFTLPTDRLNGAVVITKCNLHGMWRAEIK